MKKYLPAIGIMILAASLTMLLAVMCDYYDVYLPGVVLLIPPDRRPAPTPSASETMTEPVVREQVVVIDRTAPVPPADSPLPSPSVSDSPPADKGGP